MDVFDAAYRVAHDFEPNGAVGLAKLLGKNPGTFLNKLNPNQETHLLNLGDAVQMTVITNDLRILQAFAETVGCGVFRLPAAGFPCDAELIGLLLTRDEKIGAFGHALDRALSDGHINAREARELRRWGMAVITSMMELIARLEGMSDA